MVEIRDHSENVIVAFTGLARSGKDTAATGLMKNHGFIRRAFADRLKRAVAAALGVTVAYMDDNKEQPHSISGVTYRRFLQYIGTEGFRSLWDSVWVDGLIEDVEKLRSIFPKNGLRVVVTDLRFHNEYEGLRSKYGEALVVIRVDRPGNTLSSGHASETTFESLPFDYRIVNDGSVEDLHRKVRTIVKKHFQGRTKP